MHSPREQETAEGDYTTALETAPCAPSSELARQEPVLSDGSLDEAEDENTSGGAPRGFQFWAIIASLCVTGLLSALENTVVTTSLPTIVHELKLGDSYIWVTNVFFLTRYASIYSRGISLALDLQIAFSPTRL